MLIICSSERPYGASLLMFLLVGIVGRHYLLSFRKGLFSVPCAKGDKRGSIEANPLSI